MREPFDRCGRLLAGIVLLVVLAGLALWTGGTAADPTGTDFPDEGGVALDREAFVGEQIVLSQRVVDAALIVMATHADGDRVSPTSYQVRPS